MINKRAMKGGIDVAAIQLNTQQHICLSAKLKTSAEISSLIKKKGGAEISFI